MRTLGEKTWENMYASYWNSYKGDEKGKRVRLQINLLEYKKEFLFDSIILFSYNWFST